MCGRYSLILDEHDLPKRYGKPATAAYAVTSRYNVAPSQNAPVVTASGIEAMRWGLLPPWLKDPRGALGMINARAESLLERAAYKPLFKTRRCLVPATGFYEWLDTPTGKQPYYFMVTDRPLISFAGLWTERLDAEGLPVRSFTIITTRPNGLVAKVHDRMPVVLSEDQESIWLDVHADLHELSAMLDPYDAQFMRAVAVSKAVNTAANDSSDLIDPISDQATS